VQKHFSKPTKLLLKHLTGDLSEPEAVEFQLWMDADPKNKVLVEFYKNGSHLSAQLKQADLITDDFREQEKDRLYNKLFDSAEQAENKVINIGYRRIWWRRIAVGAGVIGVCFIAWMYAHKPETKAELTQTSVKTVQPVPGSNQAMLILGDGTRMTLKEAASTRNIAQGNNINSVDADKGIVTYSKITDQSAGVSTTNSLITPNGGQYKLQLSDGTMLFLNAGSSVTYPTVFSDKENTREVSVSGEVYMEVAKNKAKPFIVHVNNSYDIQVLGTSFTVNAYYDEPFNKVTLIEGSVQLNSKNDKNIFAVKLIPGDQAQITESKRPLIKKVDVDEATAFVKGRFYFSDDDIPSVARQLSRWYNVEAIYEGHVSTKRLNGQIQRSLPLNKVIDMLIGMGAALELKDNKLIIRP
jgi:transmembrane sensor